MLRRWLVPLLVGLALTGCTTQLPAGPTLQEVRALQVEEARQWWEGLYAGEPMPPIDVVQYAMPETRDALAGACVEDWLGRPMDGDIMSLSQDERDELNLASWTCYARYPLDPAVDARLSPAQLDYTYAYFAERTVPCLERLGYPMPPAQWTALTVGSYASTGYPAWNPYWQVRYDFSEEFEDADFILGSCPPPPFDYPWLGY